jgi:phospholipase A1
MLKMENLLPIMGVAVCCFYTASSFADTSITTQATPAAKHATVPPATTPSRAATTPATNAAAPTSTPATNHLDNDNAVSSRVKKEDKISPRSFSIAFHRPTYVLPFYYTRTPYNSIYAGQTPENEKLKRDELKFQLSFKVPVWKNILNHPSTLYLAYTQMSYWQAYDHDPFFRETDFEPELFLANEINYHLGGSWYLNFLNVGLDHQSNGYGGALERSWNRATGALVVSSDDWIVAIRPWIIFKGNNTYQRQNPDMQNFMGNGTILIGYKFGHQLISFETRNMIESGGRRSGNTLSWSFPITDYLKGYAQIFSGYGQSLIEYNHRTNSFGLGISMSDWV